MGESLYDKPFVRSLCQFITLLLFIFLFDLLIAESLDTSVFIEPNQGLKIGYVVPYTGGGTSECYPIAFSKLKHGYPVKIKRSIFLDVCIVLPLNRNPIDKNPREYLINRHSDVH